MLGTGCAVLVVLDLSLGVAARDLQRRAFHLTAYAPPRSLGHNLPAQLIRRRMHPNYSSKIKPRFFSPSNVSMAANRRELSTNHGPNFEFTSRTNTRSSAW